MHKTVTFLFAAISVSSAMATELSLKPSALLLPTVATAKASKPNANANSNSKATARANSSSRGGSAQGVGSQGQSTSIDSHAVYEAQARNPVSTSVAPPLTSSNDTCMGSTSVGASAVSFGFSVGSTWTDNNCLMLKNAREMWNMGFKGAALARLCMDSLNKEALQATGINCPERRRADDNSADALRAKNNADDVYRY